MTQIVHAPLVVAVKTFGGTTNDGMPAVLLQFTYADDSIERFALCGGVPRALVAATELALEDGTDDAMRLIEGNDVA